MRSIHASVCGKTGLSLRVRCSYVPRCRTGPDKARAADLVVAYDQSQLLRLPRPASSVIIGVDCRRLDSGWQARIVQLHAELFADAAIGDDSTCFEMISQRGSEKTKFSELAGDSGEGRQ